jgi:hypothetical protein
MQHAHRCRFMQIQGFIVIHGILGDSWLGFRFGDWVLAAWLWLCGGLWHAHYLNSVVESGSQAGRRFPAAAAAHNPVLRAATRMNAD